MPPDFTTNICDEENDNTTDVDVKTEKMIHKHGKPTEQPGQIDDTKHTCDNIIWPRKSKP